jgi:hypothetical protein
MTALSAFRPRVAMLAPTATDPMIDQCVLDACIDFCERSLVVRGMLTAFPTVVDQAEYVLAPPAGQSLVMLQRLWCDADELTPLGEDGIQTPFGFISTVTGVPNVSGTPRYFNETVPGSISLFPRPATVQTINVRAALRPTRTATTVADQLFEDWVEGIVSGALARLFLAPGDMMDAKKAQYHSLNFNAHVDAAILRAAGGGRVRAEMSIMPVRI